jgi:hypothetical protein
MRLERSAGELRGEARVAALRRWVAIQLLQPMGIVPHM